MSIEDRLGSIEQVLGGLKRKLDEILKVGHPAPKAGGGGPVAAPLCLWARGAMRGPSLFGFISFAAPIWSCSANDPCPNSLCLWVGGLATHVLQYLYARLGRAREFGAIRQPTGKAAAAELGRQSGCARRTARASCCRGPPVPPALHQPAREQLRIPPGPGPRGPRPRGA